MKDAKTRAEEAIKAVSVAEGRLIAINDQINADLEELREVLECEPGEERQALASLKEQIDFGEKAIFDILHKIEELREEHGA